MGHTPSSFRLALILFATVFLGAIDGIAASVQAYIQPPRARPQEVVTYVITVRDGTPQGVPTLRLPLQIGQTTGHQVSQRIEIINGRRSMNVQFSWGVAAREPGEFVIAPQQVIVDGQVMMTNEVRFVAESGGTQGSPQATGDNPMAPRLELSLEKTEFYLGEVVPIQAQLLVPRGAPGEVRIRRTGLVEMEKDDFAISRFPQQSQQTVVRINNIDHVALTYRSTISALRAGDLQVGPGSMKVVVDVPVANNRSPFGGAFQGFFNMGSESRNMTLTSGEVPVKVLPLPEEGKPPGFSGAVGDFAINATVSPDTLKVGEPLTVELLVNGKGNFDALTVPEMTQSQGWKSYPPRRYSADGVVDQSSQPTAERRIGFSLVLVPEQIHSELPPFEMSFFSPSKGEYVTLRTAAFPLTIEAGANAPTPDSDLAIATEGEVPKAIPISMPRTEITDILTEVPATARWIQAASPALIRQPGFWVAQAVPVSLLFGAAFWVMAQRRRERLYAGRAGRLRQLWKNVEAAPDDSEFLRCASQLIFAAHPDTPIEDEHLNRILHRYEEGRFSGTTETAEPLSSAEKNDYQKHLSALVPTGRPKPKNPAAAPPQITATALVAFCLLTTVTAANSAKSDETYTEARSALEAGDYLKAQYKAESLLKEDPPALSSEGFQILGHARYRLEDPGQAVLQYDRALLLNPRAPEARQNLRLLDAQMRYLTFAPTSPLVGWSLYLTLNEWTLLCGLGAWLVLLGLAARLLLRARKTASPRRGGLLTGLAIFTGCLILIPAITFLALRPSPEDRVGNLAIVTSKDVRAFTAATRTAGSVADLPPGSQVRCLEERGAWCYIEIPDPIEPVRGWVEALAITDLWPWSVDLLP